MKIRRAGGRRKVTCVFLITFSLLAVFVTEVPREARAQVTEDWVATFDVTSGLLAPSMELDSGGNIYVTGRLDDNITTWAYDPYGNELWVSTYDGPANDYDAPWVIAVDSSLGVVYVTGRSMGIYTGQDYVTIAYDLSGNELWVSRYNGPGDSRDQSFDIALDSHGIVYVTGRSKGEGTDYDYSTVAYDPYGNELWVARYNGPGNGPDKAWGIAVDNSLGCIYVTGESYSDKTDEDFATVAYDLNGNEIWVSRYNGPANYSDRANDIVVDESTGMIYITGDSIGINSAGDYATVAINPNGIILWVARYNGPRNEWDSPTAMTIDSSGNIIVTGRISLNSIYSDFATVSYDKFGNELWVAIYDGPGHDQEAPDDITVDDSDNIYITGYCAKPPGQGKNDDFVTIKYDSLGNELWEIRYNSPEDTQDWAYDVEVDSQENVYISGWSSKNTKYVTVKYSQDSTNQPPVAEAHGPYFYPEGTMAVVHASSSYDPEGDPLVYRWDFDNDGTWDTGWSDILFAVHQYGDDFADEVVLQVSDGSHPIIDTAKINISNVAPSIEIDTSFTADVELGLRVAGRKYNDVAMTIYEDGNPAGYISVERTPGSPDDQMVWIPITIDQSKTYTATVTFTPEDPPNVGANPVWIYIKYEDGSIEEIHHTFNVQQSIKRNSEHWNHIEPWEVELNDYLKGGQIEVTSHITDPGSDDIFITYSYGSQVVNVTFLNNPPNPDPYPSPDGNQVDIIDTVKLNYEGPGILTVTAEDDDGGITTKTLYIV